MMETFVEREQLVSESNGTKVNWNGYLSLLLVGMVQAYRLRGQRVFCTVTGKITMPRVDPDVTRRYSTNYGYLAHFGFCTKPKRGYFELTQAAFDYVDEKEKAPAFIVSNGPRCVLTGPRKVSIREVTNIDDLNANPLWWENY